MGSVVRMDYWTKAVPKGQTWGQTWVRRVQSTGGMGFGEGKEEGEG